MNPAIKVIQQNFEVEKAVDKPLPVKIGEPVNPDRVIRFRASDDSLDRHNEVILAKGWVLDDYVKNPVVMEFHDYWSWPLGMASAAGVVGKALMIDAEFDPPEVDENADKVFGKIKHGSIKAGSVGFIPKEIMVPNQNERMAWAEERVDELKAKSIVATVEKVLKGHEAGFANVQIADFDNPEHKGLFDKYPEARRIYTKQELLEWTICPIPANPNALAAGMSKRLEKLFGTNSVDTTALEIDSDDMDAVRVKVWEMSRGLKSLKTGYGKRDANKNGDG